MSQLIFTKIEVGRLSRAGMQVLKAALTHAHTNRNVKLHEIPLDEFCASAGIGLLPGEAMRLLLLQGLRVRACEEYIDTEKLKDGDIPYRSSPMFNFASANDSRVAFELCNLVLREDVLKMVLDLPLPLRQFQ